MLNMSQLFIGEQKSLFNTLNFGFINRGRINLITVDLLMLDYSRWTLVSVELFLETK